MTDTTHIPMHESETPDTEESLAAEAAAITNPETEVTTSEVDTSTTVEAEAPVEATAEKVETMEDLEQVVTSKGLNFSELKANFIANGGWTDEDMASMKAAGMSDEDRDTYTETVSNVVLADVYKIAGSKEQFDELLAWAEENLTPEEKAEYDTAIMSGNTRSLTLKGLEARMAMSQGQQAQREIRGNASGGGDVFTNQKQISAAINDYRYEDNLEGWADETDAKILRSRI